MTVARAVVVGALVALTTTACSTSRDTTSGVPGTRTGTPEATQVASDGPGEVVTVPVTTRPESFPGESVTLGLALEVQANGLCTGARSATYPAPGTVGTAWCDTPAGTLVFTTPEPSGWDGWLARGAEEICDSVADTGTPPGVLVVGDGWTVTGPVTVSDGRIVAWDGTTTVADLLEGEVVSPGC